MSLRVEDTGKWRNDSLVAVFHTDIVGWYK